MWKQPVKRISEGVRERRMNGEIMYIDGADLIARSEGSCPDVNHPPMI
jgi:hypothetical protein